MQLEMFQGETDASTVAKNRLFSQTRTKMTYFDEQRAITL